MISAEQIDQSPAFGRWCDAFLRLAGVRVHFLDPNRIESHLQTVSSGFKLCRLLCQRWERCRIDRRRFAARLRTADACHAGPFAMRCTAGLTITALPVRLADGMTVFLSTGPMLITSRAPGSARKQVAGRLRKHGDLPREARASVVEWLREIPVREPRDFKAAITLLRLLAEHLSYMSLQMLAVPENIWTNCVPLRRACELVEERFTENLHLDEIAHQVGASRSHLSHEFRRRLGLTFTEFLAERRLIEMKRLLRNPSLRVSEAILASGFQSVSQGNRIFRGATDMSPSRYRSSLKS